MTRTQCPYFWEKLGFPYDHWWRFPTAEPSLDPLTLIPLMESSIWTFPLAFPFQASLFFPWLCALCSGITILFHWKLLLPSSHWPRRVDMIENGHRNLGWSVNIQNASWVLCLRAQSHIIKRMGMHNRLISLVHL